MSAAVEAVVPPAPAARTRWGRMTLVALLGAAALAPPWVLGSFHLFQLTNAVAYAVAILGLTVMTGVNGQISLGHGAFYAVGAYVAAALMSHFAVPYWATLPAAALAAGGLGFLVGFPALRLSGLYLALTTLALAVAVPQLLKFRGIEEWTGGVQGLFISKPDAPFGLPLDADQWLYLFTTAVAGGCFLLVANLLRGRTGRAMRAVRDHPLAAEAMGVDLAGLKTRSFALSAALTGLAGALGAIAVEFVAPDAFGVDLSINLFVGMVVGGAGSLWGALLGGLFVVFVPNLAEEVSKAAPGVIYGIILLALLYVQPGGVAGAARAVLRRLRRPNHPSTREIGQ